MFKFGFHVGEEEAQEEHVACADMALPCPSPSPSPLQPLARRIELTSGTAGGATFKDVLGELAWQYGDVTLSRAVPRGDVCPAIAQETDLIPGVYEGGMKIWEASLDLVEYLVRSGMGTGPQEESDEARPENGSRKQVLELGCGHGFPGIIGLRQGMQVCFSDFNAEVIDRVTVPNVRLNVEERHWHLAEYYCGDWRSLSPLLDKRDGGGRFDLILTAETLYTTTVAEKVLAMILGHLAVDGEALVASKRFYFGTGGSTQHFRQLAAADGRLACADAVVIDTGKGNIREVLRVSWREGVAGLPTGASPR